MTSDQRSTGFGANSWLVEEMYEQFRDDPSSVSETWREFFEDYRPMVAAPGNGAAPAPAAPVAASTRS